MGIEAQKLWKAAVYIRISKENGEDTLENQFNTIIRHLDTLGDIRVCAVKIDDGYSGLHINRPAFQEMLYAIQQGIIDCVAVRDLSRLSRNHIDAGRYVQEIFPAQGVRFISVFEGLDFVKAPQYSVMMMVGFRNLLNEEYSRNLSCSVKNALAQGYRNGMYLGAFTVYGYKKASDNRHHLVPDPPAAKIVRDIFQMKLEGMSAAGIADQLNQEGISSPAENKKTTNFYTCFQKHPQTKWTPKAVSRILSNRIYTGCLEQGKSMKPYFKATARKAKSQNEWILAENTHEAIILNVQFEAVSRLLLMDTRKVPGEKCVSPLAGFIRCKSCGQNMVMKQHKSTTKTHLYYVCCGKNQENKCCPAHRISKTDLEEKVLRQIRSRMDDVLRLDNAIVSLDMVHIHNFRRQELSNELVKLRVDLELSRKCFRALYDKYALSIYEDPDLSDMRLRYSEKCSIIEKQIQDIEANMLDAPTKEAVFDWIERYKPFYSFEEITRPLLAYLVRRITVDGKKEVRVEFLHEQDFEFAQSAVLSLRKI